MEDLDGEDPADLVEIEVDHALRALHGQRSTHLPEPRVKRGTEGIAAATAAEELQVIDLPGELRLRGAREVVPQLRGERGKRIHDPHPDSLVLHARWILREPIRCARRASVV